MGEAQKGKVIPAELRERWAKSHKGVPLASEHTRNIMIACQVKPNIVELQLEAILNKVYPDTYGYTGDGAVVIGGLCPDFTDINGQKKVIELFGDYWHSPEVTGKSYEQEQQDRIDRFAAFGFDCLIIWEHELIDVQSVTEKIRAFNQRKENKLREGEAIHQGSKGE